MGTDNTLTVQITARFVVCASARPQHGDYVNCLLLHLVITFIYAVAVKLPMLNLSRLHGFLSNRSFILLGPVSTTSVTGTLTVTTLNLVDYQ